MKGQAHRTEVRAKTGSGADEAERREHATIRSWFKRMARRALRRLGRLLAKETT
jgi:hypothetical protein